MAEVYTNTHVGFQPDACIGFSINAEIQPSVPSSVVAIGIMIITKTSNNGLPNERLYAPNATTVTAIKPQVTPADKAKTCPS